MSDTKTGMLIADENGKSVAVLLPVSDKPKPDGSIALNRDHAADAVAITRLLRTKQPDMAMFILSSYANDCDGLQGLVGATAAFANALLTTIDSMAAEANRTSDALVPGADAVLAKAAEAVVTFDPGQTQDV
jgi:hypothetical protein